eukprot:scaffold1561_cov184-Ochromonas_danica.AAC.3
MKQMIWQYLPRDLLHCVYSEWLTWSDLSVLDIACLSNEDREEWLTSLSSLVMGEACQFEETKRYYALYNNKLVNYYQWLGSRKVLVREDFPVRLSVLEDFLHHCDPVTFCPAVHSILMLDEIEKPAESYEISRAESSLSCFVSHCSHLEEVEIIKAAITSSTTTGGIKYDWGNEDDIVYTTLNQHLRDNQLVKLDLYIDDPHKVVVEKIGSLLSKHVNSLREIRIIEKSPGIRHVLRTLISSKPSLHVLNIVINYNGLKDPIPLLLQYLSSSGLVLKKLDFSYLEGDTNAMLTNELLVLIGTSCPNLVELSWLVEGFDDVEGGDVIDSSVASLHIINPIEIYRLCPNFKCLSTSEVVMWVDEAKSRLDLHFVSKLIYVRFEDIMECVLLSLQRGKYGQVGLSVRFELEVEEWKLVVSKIGSMLISLDAEVTEDILISLLLDIPRLQMLEVYAVGAITDRSMTTIAQHGRKLTKLHVTRLQRSLL